MKEIRILGVLVTKRCQSVEKVQDILTRYGCSIKTRLGLHELEEGTEDSLGLMILELMGDPQECMRLENELWTVDGIKVQKMVF